MTYHRGDVILVYHQPAVRGASREAKTRPLVVVSSAAFQAERAQDVLVALVTTKLAKYRGRTDYTLQDWQDAGLHQPSVVRSTLATVESSQISSRVGRLTDADQAGLDAALRFALGLT